MSFNAHARSIVGAFYVCCSAGYGIIAALTTELKKHQL
ncbi:hypothetical protein ECH7EC4206_A5303 [Escherichia coli O157:H7 str. EC4206]|nr:hypothetical protein ECH7EC4206_A5303 [Escherichia coli O157:H7 str. EC4206]